MSQECSKCYIKVTFSRQVKHVSYLEFVDLLELNYGEPENQLNILTEIEKAEEEAELLQVVEEREEASMKNLQGSNFLPIRQIILIFAATRSK